MLMCCDLWKNGPKSNGDWFTVVVAVLSYPTLHQHSYIYPSIAFALIYPCSIFHFTWLVIFPIFHIQRICLILSTLSITKLYTWYMHNMFGSALGIDFLSSQLMFLPFFLQIPFVHFPTSITCTYNISNVLNVCFLVSCIFVITSVYSLSMLWYVLIMSHFCLILTSTVLMPS